MVLRNNLSDLKSNNQTKYHGTQNKREISSYKTEIKVQFESE